MGASAAAIAAGRACQGRFCTAAVHPSAVSYPAAANAWSLRHGPAARLAKPLTLYAAHAYEAYQQREPRTLQEVSTSKVSTFECSKGSATSQSNGRAMARRRRRTVWPWLQGAGALLRGRTLRFGFSWKTGPKGDSAASLKAARTQQEQRGALLHQRVRATCPRNSPAVRNPGSLAGGGRAPPGGRAAARARPCAAVCLRALNLPGGSAAVVWWCAWHAH